MLHPSRSSGPALAHWLVIAAALAFGLLEWLALARSRWQDRRLRASATAGRHGGRAA